MIGVMCPFIPLRNAQHRFIAVFMREVLRSHFDCEMHENLILVFPLHNGSIYKNGAT